MDQKQVIKNFVEFLQPGLVVESWPDEQERQKPAIDAAAGQFAIEHTSVDILPRQRECDAQFSRATNGIEEEFKDVVSFRLVITLPFDAIKKGQDWDKICRTFKQWIRDEAPNLPDGRHTIDDARSLPFTFYAIKNNRPGSGVYFSRNCPDDETFAERLSIQLEAKASKLRSDEWESKTHILLVQSNDVALANDVIIRDAIFEAFHPSGLPNGVDQIWLADCVGEPLLRFAQLLPVKSPPI